VRPYLRNGMPIAIGRAGAVISHFADGDAHLALRTIAEFPCPEQDNLPAANMRQIALAALSGAGASSEPGNPGGEPVSGPGNAGEQRQPQETVQDLPPMETLRRFAASEIDHINSEDCPSYSDHDTRDPNCPVCRALLSVEGDSQCAKP
ncbi:hypothetical protein AAIH73_14740, partial [Pseudomonas aeruginosa]